jgi:protein required for attachment to host cells
MEFARRIVHQLDAAHRRGTVRRLVVIAGPTFLGLLREAMPKSLHDIMAAEVCKDLVHEDDNGVLAHIPLEAFEPVFKPYYSARG